jgi:hypothetical protein
MFHHEIPVPHTGKRGRPQNSKVALSPELMYCTVKKFRKGGHIVKVIRSIVFGSESQISLALSKSNSNTINTSFIERTNLDLRLWDAHLTRKTLKFAKNIDYLKAKLALSIMKYNFIKKHTTLTKLANYVDTTPGMAANLTDHPWKFEELLEKVFC